MKYTFLQTLISNETLTKEQIEVAFKNKSKKEIDNAISFFLDKKIIIKKQDYFTLSGKYKNKLGVFSSKKNEYGFVDVNSSTSFFVPSPFVNGSMSGDIVYFLTKQDRKGKPGDKIARVISTILHKNQELIGKVIKEEGKMKFVKDDNFTYNIVSLGRDFINEGDWVTARIVGRSNNQLDVKISKKLGSEESADLFYNLALQKFNIETEFNMKTINEAKNFTINIEKELKERTDHRKQLIVTIDGVDAKDLDDAFSLTKKGDNYELYIHIADVSHFVTEGTSIDKDAFSRGNSVYLIDRVVPMLPFELSNDLCSLNTNGDKVAFTSKMTFDSLGKMIGKKAYQSIIRSSGRLNYAEVNDLFNKKIDVVKDKEITDMLFLAKELSDKMKNNYRNNRMLDFVVPEVKVILDEKRQPVKLVKRKQDISERLIENFMIAANVATAEMFKEASFPGMFRIHSKPKTEKVQIAIEILRSFGYHNVSVSTGADSAFYQNALKWLSDKSFEQVVNKFLVQTMEKAEYSIDNIGHFGLGLKNYTHFTSPIRRYPDLIVHRYLKLLINSNKSSYIDKDLENKKLSMAADNSSSRERDAISAERYLSDIMKAKYMEKHIGETFNSYITNINRKGIFVELENAVNGFVDFNLEGIDSKGITQSTNTIQIKGLGTLKLGDDLKVVVQNCDTINGRVNFSILRDNENDTV